MEKVKITVTIDKKIDEIINILAHNNHLPKSAIVREALELYVNNMLSDPLEDIKKRLDDIEDKLERELNRYNSILAKSALYSIASRQHLVALHSSLKNKDEAIKVAEKTWNIAIERLKDKNDWEISK